MVLQILERYLTFKGFKPILKGFTDIALSSDLDGRKLTSEYLLHLEGEAVFQQSKLQKRFALSTTEANILQ